MIKVTERTTRKGQHLELGYSDDGNWVVALLDGKTVASVAGIGKVQKHNFGAEWTHQIGPVLLTEAEATAINQARDTFFAAQRADKEVKLAANVPGLNELRAAIDDEIRYQEQFEQMMEDENNDGARPPKPVTIKYADVAAKYPRAAIYIKAENYSLSEHYAKSTAGDKAMKLIEDGGSLADAEQILNNWLPANAWND